MSGSDPSLDGFTIGYEVPREWVASVESIEVLCFEDGSSRVTIEVNPGDFDSDQALARAGLAIRSALIETRLWERRN